MSGDHTKAPLDGRAIFTVLYTYQRRHTAKKGPGSKRRKNSLFFPFLPRRTDTGIYGKNTFGVRSVGRYWQFIPFLEALRRERKRKICNGAPASNARKSSFGKERVKGEKMAAARNEKRELGEINKRNFLYVFSHSEPYTGNWRPGTIKLWPVFGCQLFFPVRERKKAMTKRERRKKRRRLHAREQQKKCSEKITEMEFPRKLGRGRERERKKEEDQRPISKVASRGLQSVRLPRREIGRTAEYRTPLSQKYGEKKKINVTRLPRIPPTHREAEFFADGGREEAFLPFSLSFSTQQCLLLDLSGGWGGEK